MRDLGYKNSAIWQNAFHINLFYVLYMKHFECIVRLQHSGYYIDQNVEHILLNVLLLRLCYRKYVTLSETEGLSWKVNMYGSGTKHLKFWYSSRGTAENL